MNADGFWRDRRVLVTGHTGFKGAWLSLWLTRLGARVHGLALPPAAMPNLFRELRFGTTELNDATVDLRDHAAVLRRVAEVGPEVVFHLAAQPLVRESYRAPVDTYATNVMGTVHLLDALRRTAGVRSVVIVTSDKVYADGAAHAEEDRLGGDDPYSSSKACAELVTATYRTSFFADGPPIATARAGNVFGGGDWAVDRLVPDAVRSRLTGTALCLRYPEAVRPWQHVLDVLAGYLLLAERLATDPDFPRSSMNFGPDHAGVVTVADLIARVDRLWQGRPWQVQSTRLSELPKLMLDATRARTDLGWSPRLSLDDGLAWTVAWYRAWADGHDMRTHSLNELERYRTFPAPTEVRS